MGIYRSLLEDEISTDIEDIAEEIDDNDANEENQDYADYEYGPDEGVNEILGENYIPLATLYESNLLVSKYMGITSLNEANGVLLEGVGDFISSIVEKVKEFFKKVWDWLKKAIDSIMRQFMSGKKLASKYKKKIEEGYGMYDTKKVKGYNFAGLIRNKDDIDDDFKLSKSEIVEHFSNLSANRAGASIGRHLIMQHADIVNNIINNTFDISQIMNMSITRDQFESFKESFNDGKDTLRDNVANEWFSSNTTNARSDTSFEDFEDDFNEYLHGGETSEDNDITPMTASDVIDILKNKEKNIKAFNKFKANFKKATDTYIKSLNRIRKEISRGINDTPNADSETKSLANSMVTFAINITQFYWNTNNTVANKLIKCYIKAINDQYKQARKFAMVYIRLAGMDMDEVDKYNEKYNESTIFTEARRRRKKKKLVKKSKFK